jgi:hypothetical protein
MSRKNLDGNSAFETRVSCPVHFSHTASPERRLDLIGPEFCARGEGIRARHYRPNTPKEKRRSGRHDCVGMAGHLEFIAAATVRTVAKPDFGLHVLQ